MAKQPSLLNAAIVAVAVCASVALFLLMESTTPRKRGADRAPPSPAAAGGTAAGGAVAGEGSARSTPLPYASDRDAAPPGPTAPPVPALTPEREELLGAELQRRMAKAISDLEWTPGLPEPPQVNVARGPEPWHPPMGPTAPAPTISDVSPSSAAAGTQVRIRGRNFRSAQVVFGEHAAQVVKAGDEELTVIAPEGEPGAVPVAVTNGDGTFAVANDAFTYRE